MKKYAENSFWLILYKVAVAVLHLLFNVIVARLYSGEVFGIINYTLSIVSILNVFASLGMDSILIDEFSKNKEEEPLILSTALILRIVISTIIVVVYLIYIIINGTISVFDNQVLLLQLLMLIAQSFDVVNCWLIATSKSKINVRNTVCSQLVFSAFQIVSLVIFDSILLYVIFSVLQTLAIGVLNLIYFQRKSTLKPKCDFNIAKRILARSYHLILTNFTIVLYTQMDKIMLGDLLDKTSVGFYSIGTSLCNLWGFVPLAIANSYSPHLFELKSSGKEREYIKELSRLFSILLFIGLACSIIMFAIANPIVKILYGDAYSGAINPLRILCVSNFFAVLGSIRGATWIISENKQRYSKYFCLLGAVVNIVLNLITIPKLGCVGAALSTLVTELVVAIIAPSMFKATRPFVVIVIKSFIEIPVSIKDLVNRLKINGGSI